METFLLDECGRPDLLGFNYLLYILKTRKDNNINMTEIYNEISEVFNVTTKSVERNIRTYKDATNKKYMTNKEFVCTLLIKYYSNKKGHENK